MTIELIRPGAHRAAPVIKPLVSRDCGPEGCEVDWLTSRRIETDLDIDAFNRFALEQGWGDGLPLIPPTDARVRTFLSENDRYPDELIGTMPDSSECTVEKIVINAVMAGAPPESLELLIAMIASIADPDFELYGVNATTAPVYPAFVVNGPVRHDLAIPYGYGCLGGVPGASAAIGRTIRLLMRNVAGQTTGGTSQTTFGSPGRIAGVVTGEWEEKSPWSPLAERRGVAGSAVTSFGTMGTMNVIDTTSHSARDFLEMIGRSYAYAGCNNFSGAVPFGEALIAINPICAEIVGREIPRIEDVQELVWKYASLGEGDFNKEHRDQLALQERIRADGRVYATPEPKDVLLFVAGGLGGLHAACFHTFGTSLAQTKPVASAQAAQAQAAE
ncbi:hypothetical protein LWE61_01830 [Sphingobium sufflavum]|uniref:hypothetical protein n=1 Tax=Sphingobium sufflavum TaxID=1129547 RepID=UPI001F2A90E1|nr:hypothetical protein [Sphingobium sufflavum]MCE7795291.1 hypothetical protein [Sphingobium sufflavum]